MIDFSKAKSRVKEEIGRKCEAMSFGTNFEQKEFQYSKDVRTKKEAKAARNIYDSSSESSIEPDTSDEEEESSEEVEVKQETQKPGQSSQAPPPQEEQKPKIKPIPIKKPRPQTAQTTYYNYSDKQPKINPIMAN